MSVVDDIKERLDIVDVVSGYLTLQKAGSRFKAPCPFHTEKTPSFTVSPDRQSWHCFGACSTGGDAFSFVMRKEGLGFGETLRLLADKVGVTLQTRQDGDRTDLLYRANQEAARFYSEVLKSDEGRAARAYLAQRGVDSPTAEAFQIGFSPLGHARLKEHLSGLGFDLDHAIDSGLLRRREDGSLRDFFWGRLMFPIHDRQGRVAGFGARSMDGSDPKYINTAATRVFDKRATLYGLHKAVAPIRESGTVVIVEGYMDVMAAHQHGYSNVVASMGTALTELQVSRIKSIARSSVLALDPDAAGQEATLRSLETSWRVFERQQVRGTQRPLFQSEQLVLKIMALPPGRDPDEVIRGDPAEWEKLVRDAAPFIDFVIGTVGSRYDLGSATGKAQAAEALGPLIASVGNAVEQEHYFTRLAATLGVSKESLEASIGKPGAAPRVPPRTAPRGGVARQTGVTALFDERHDSLEEYVLAVLLQRPDLHPQAEAAAPEYFHGTENREVFTCLQICSTIEKVRSTLDDDLLEHLDHLLRIDVAPSETWPAESALSQALRRLEQRHLQEFQETLLASQDAADPPRRELEEAIVSVNQRLKELFSQRH